MNNHVLIEKYLHSETFRLQVDTNVIEYEIAVEFFDDLEYALSGYSDSAQSIVNPNVLEWYLDYFIVDFIEGFPEAISELYFIMSHFYFFHLQERTIDEKCCAQLLFTLFSCLNDVTCRIDVNGDDFLKMLMGSPSGKTHEFVNQSSQHPDGNNVIPFRQHKESSVELQKVYQLRIDLKGFKPPIWRRVLVPADSTFEELHQIIQALFEWQNCQMYHFFRRKTEIERKGSENSSDDFDTQKADKTLLQEDMDSKTKLTYTYGLDNCWEHEIKLEKILSKEELPEKAKGRLPYCLKAVGAAPVETSSNQDLYKTPTLEEINHRLRNYE